MEKTDRKKQIAEIRLKNFLIAQMEVEINGRCTILGKTFKKMI